MIGQLLYFNMGYGTAGTDGDGEGCYYQELIVGWYLGEILEEICRKPGNLVAKHGKNPGFPINPCDTEALGTGPLPTIPVEGPDDLVAARSNCVSCGGGCGWP